MKASPYSILYSFVVLNNGTVLKIELVQEDRFVVDVPGEKYRKWIVLNEQVNCVITNIRKNNKTKI